jgi:hypothetical protein
MEFANSDATCPYHYDLVAMVEIFLGSLILHIIFYNFLEPTDSERKGFDDFIRIVVTYLLLRVVV